MNLLHLMPALSPGGPTRSLLTLVRETRRARPDVRHTVVSLSSADYLPLAFALRREGAEIQRAADIEQVAGYVERADVVLVHFYNTPALWRTLAGALPSARFVIWAKVLGEHAPQRFNTRLFACAAHVAFTAPPPAYLPAQFKEARVIPALADHARVSGVVAKPHDGFNADYVGTTNWGKMHPRFVTMLARVAVPELKVRVCGGALEPAMAAELKQTPQPGRFECCGFVQDIASILETSDVFAYPLAERTYATSDQSLQEAMLAGVPPVILPHGGPGRFVTDGKNGIIARNEDEFVAAIEYLHRNPERRAELARNARQSAQVLFNTEKHAVAILELLQEASQAPKTRLMPADGPANDGRRSGAALFLMSQDWDEASAQTAVKAWRAGQTDELAEYASGLDDDAFQIEGGILHWRREVMDDPLLRSWSALWLMRHGRVDEARHEMAEAVRLGAPRAAIRGL
ncbi:MAG: glycosyltransferase family 4 protein [Xanthobacteraceae bacterium]|nr:glycosyltransferase family 4 protein [Xanthobacteraceae bacterium]